MKTVFDRLFKIKKLDTETVRTRVELIMKELESKYHYIPSSEEELDLWSSVLISPFGNSTSLLAANFMMIKREEKRIGPY